MVGLARCISGMWARSLRISCGRVIILLAVIWALLQVLHMTLLGKLEARKAEIQRSRLTKILHDESRQLWESMRDGIETAQIVDSSGEYKIVNHLYKPQAGESEGKPQKGLRKRVYPIPVESQGNEVTLVTQCSVNHMHHLMSLAERWNGPISVSIFAPDQQGLVAMEFIMKLFQCVEAFRYNVSVHLVYPFVQAPVINTPLVLPTEFSCPSLEKDLQDNKETLTNYDLSGIKYPNNLLRNVALSNSRTKYVFTIDIDMLPSSNLHRDFSAFIESHYLSQTDKTKVLDDRTVFVVPAFEVKPEFPAPAEKLQLLRLWQNRSLRPFYWETCWKCHRWTDYEAWRNLTLGGSPLEVGYEVEWQDPWEPFYIAPRTVPNFDERFKQYGFNRISQVGFVSFKNDFASYFVTKNCWQINCFFF